MADATERVRIVTRHTTGHHFLFTASTLRTAHEAAAAVEARVSGAYRTSWSHDRNLKPGQVVITEGEAGWLPLTKSEATEADVLQCSPELSYEQAQQLAALSLQATVIYDETPARKGQMLAAVRTAVQPPMCNELRVGTD